MKQSQSRALMKLTKRSGAHEAVQGLWSSCIDQEVAMRSSALQRQILSPQLQIIVKLVSQAS